jgi:hypothetical protein
MGNEAASGRPDQGARAGRQHCGERYPLPASGDGAKVGCRGAGARPTQAIGTGRIKSAVRGWIPHQRQRKQRGNLAVRTLPRLRQSPAGKQEPLHRRPFRHS